MWVGNPGDLLRLPDLQPGPSSEEDRGLVTQTSVSGGVTAQYMFTDPKRVFNVPLKWLRESELADLLALAQGQYGDGPFVLLTEFDTNLLEANQSSGTDSRGTSYGFVPTHGSVTSVVGGYKGRRQLDWQLPVTPPVSDPSVKLNWKNNTPGIPGLPNTDYAFSVYVKAVPANEIRLKLSFRDTANTVLGEANWQTVLVGADWTRVDVAGKSPDGTAHVAPLVISTDPAASQLVSLDHPQLEFGTAATSWKPGLGVPQVVVADVPRGYPLQGWHTPGAIKFLEVGF